MKITDFKICPVCGNELDLSEINLTFVCCMSNKNGPYCFAISYDYSYFDYFVFHGYIFELCEDKAQYILYKDTGNKDIICSYDKDKIKITKDFVTNIIQDTLLFGNK